MDHGTETAGNAEDPGNEGDAELVSLDLCQCGCSVMLWMRAGVFAPQHMSPDCCGHTASPLSSGRWRCCHLPALCFCSTSLCVLAPQSCPTLWDPIDWGLPGSSVHGILQARILGWVAIPWSRGSSQSRDQTPVSCIAGRFFTAEPPGKPCSTSFLAYKSPLLQISCCFQISSPLSWAFKGVHSLVLWP